MNITGFVIDGKEVPYSGTPCTSPNIPTKCPTVDAGKGEVLIQYGPLASAPVPSGALVSIFACYSNVSSFNRPWRANTTMTNVLVSSSFRRPVSGVLDQLSDQPEVCKLLCFLHFVPFLC